MRYDASDPDRVSAPNSLPRAPKPEEEKEEQEKAKRLSKVAPRKLPVGTCRATNQGLQGHDDVQKVWNNWCDATLTLTLSRTLALAVTLTLTLTLSPSPSPSPSP